MFFQDEGDTDCSDDEGDDNILDESSFSHKEMTENCQTCKKM